MEESKNQIKCRQCGGALMYAPGTSSLKCQFCGTTNEIDKSDWDYESMKVKHNFIADLDKFPESEMEEIHIVKCSHCNAETTLAPNVVSANCDFCGSPISVDGGISTRRIKPQGVIPFRVSNDEARNKFNDWIGSLWFAPGDLKNQASIESGLTGMYIPYWVYYVDTVTEYTGRRGDHYYTEEKYKDDDGSIKTRRVQHTKWQPTAGTYTKNFKDLIISGSTTLGKDAELLRRTWKLDGMVPYNEQTLTGYKSEAYSISLKDAYVEAQKIMEEEIEDGIEKQIGGDEQSIDSKSTEENNIEYKHILAPLWISTFRYNAKSYRFMINGQTGDITGDRPYSSFKITLCVVSILAALALIFLLLTS